MEMTNYEMISGAIRLRLYNGNKYLEDDVVRVSAEPYGFDGLVIVPIIALGEMEKGYATAKITESMLEIMEVTTDEVITKGIENTNYIIKTMKQMLLEDMGIDEDDPMAIMMPDDTGMYVVTNREMTCGASSIIPATKELIKMFPNGYTVLPSSIHEVIVVPTDGNGDTLNDIVKTVNENVLNSEDYLSDDIYEFVA